MKVACNNSPSFLSEATEDDEIDFTDYGAPYPSGHSFSLRCHWFYSLRRRTLGVNPNRDNDFIFVKPDHLADLFGSGLLPEHFSLLTHNSDYVIGRGYEKYLADPRLRIWLALNKNVQHPKLVSVVDGLQNPCHCFGSPKTIGAFASALTDGHMLHGHYKSQLFYANYTLDSRLHERAACAALHQPRGIPLSGRTTFLRYLIGMAESCFTFCPGGSGIESCRPYEAIYLRSVPIMHTNLPAVELQRDHGMPMVLLDDWTEAEWQRAALSREAWHRAMDGYDPAQMHMEPYCERLNRLYGARL